MHEAREDSFSRRARGAKRGRREFACVKLHRTTLGSRWVPRRAWIFLISNDLIEPNPLFAISALRSGAIAGLSAACGVAIVPFSNNDTASRSPAGVNGLSRKASHS